MKTKVNPTLIGAFVIGGLALLVIGVLAFGGSAMFTKPQRFVVYFDESVHGLDPGAAVKVRGVRVGRVADITVQFDQARHDSRVEVVCEVTKNILVGPDGERIDFAAPGQMQRLVHEGMRAELAVAGLATGMLYVELGFYDPKENALPADYADQPDRPVVPAVPSVIAEFTASVSDLLGKLRQIDYAGISQELKALLGTTRTKIAALELQPAVDEIKGAAVSVRALASDPQIRTAFEKVNATLASLQAMIARLDSEVAPTGEDLRRTLAEARTAMTEFAAAAASVRRLTGPQTGLGEETLRMLQRLGDAAESVQRLVDFLERNPNALLTGRAETKGK